MKRLTMLLLILLMLLLSCTGCTSRIAAMEALGQRSDSASWKALNAFTAALENQDAEALRALFSPNTRRSTDLDTPIAELLALTKGHRIRAEWDGLCGSGMSTHDGRRIENAFFHFDLYVDDTPYYVHFDLTYRDNRDADALGLTFLVLRSDYVACNESYVPPEGDGMYVFAYTGTDYQTRRVDNIPIIWTEPERLLTEAELLAAVDEDPLAAEVVAALGPPHAMRWSTPVYQLADEDGEARFALVNNDVRDGSLSSIRIVSETDYIRDLYNKKSLPQHTP